MLRHSGSSGPCRPITRHICCTILKTVQAPPSLPLTLCIPRHWRPAATTGTCTASAGSATTRSCLDTGKAPAGLLSCPITAACPVIAP